MYLPYGVDEQGQLVYIDQVARGKTTLCCPYCGVRLGCSVLLGPFIVTDSPMSL
jgi:hypothetical protein